MFEYGFFDDDCREYEITEHFPPVAWMNFLFNDKFTAIVSQSGGGACFYDSAATGRLTTYRQEHAVPTDRPGFYLYIREPDGSFWTPTYEPVRAELDDWKCRHGIGYTTFEARRNGLEVTMTLFVPRDDGVLLWDVRIRNTRREAIDLSTFSFVEFNFLQARRHLQEWHWCRFYTSFRYDTDRHAIKYDYRVFEDQPKLKTFMTSTDIPVSFDCNRSAFIGRGGSLDQPEAVARGRLTGSELPVGGGHGVGALQCDHTIAPGSEKRFAVSVGCDKSWQGVDALIEKYQNLANIDTALDDVQAYWRDRLDVFQCELPDKDMQTMLNIWNPYNCMINVNRKKSMSAAVTGMEKAGVQTRDAMQDSMSLTSINIATAKRFIDYILSFEYPSGEYPSRIDPTLDEPAESYAIRSDNGVWPVYTVHGYTAETGDVGYLRKTIRYYVENGQPTSGTVLEHLWRGLKHIHSKRGRTGLPLIIDVDWNDNLYMFNEDHKEESVMLGQQLVYACRLLIELADCVDGAEEVTAWCQSVITELTDILNSDAVWDGAWYRRYLYSHDGKPHLGSSARREGQIYLNTQAWAVISDTCSDGRDVRCMDAAAERLGTPFGLKLLHPAFTGIPEPEDPLYNNGPGIRENGGVFHHAHAWGVLAETRLRHGDRAHEYYRQILPNVASHQRGADLYVNEPYAFSSTTLIDPCPRAGEGDLAWFSGTVTWMYIIGTQYLLGIRPTLDGLILDPCIPSDWREYRVTRRFRGATLHTHVRNPKGVQTGVKEVRVDGRVIDGNTVRDFPAGGEMQIDVVMG